jgi:hypothetical protein
MALTRLRLNVVPDEDDPMCATIWVSVQIGENCVPFVLDSGARRSQVRDDLARTWPVLGADRSNTVFSEHLDPYVQAPPLRLGDLRIENLEMSWVRGDAPGTHNLLGLDVLRHHSCLLDLKEQTLTLDGPTDAIGSMMPLYLDGAGQTRQTGTYIMGSVRIAGVSFEEQKVAAVDLGAANATLDRPMDLILGYPTLRQATWFLDFPRHQWALALLPR